MSQTIQITAEQRAALGLHDDVHDYLVEVEGPSFATVVPVRLTFCETEKVHQTSERALREARKRAIRLAKRDFSDLIGEQRLDTADVDWLGSAHVPAGKRPRKRQ